MSELSRQIFEESRNRNKGSIDRALAETIQSLVLAGLSRTDFFKKAAFYGGTALRLVWGNNRFSEDLNISLLEPHEDFSIENYFEPLIDELKAYDFFPEIKRKKKKSSSPIDSAFIKANTRIHVLKVGVPPEIAETYPRNQGCKIKIEIDTDPPEGAGFDVVFQDEPMPYSLQVYDGPSLLAGKMDAVLSRGWVNRIKGRDWYDFAFLVKKKVPLSLTHLESRLRQKGFYQEGKALGERTFLGMLDKRIAEVDFNKAKEDVMPFLMDVREVDVWSKEYFHHVRRNLLFSP